MVAETSVTVPAELVQAALTAADEHGVKVADVSVDRIAAQAGMSRSTLLRRLGGTRQALDAAVRAVGIDPGGQPIRQRALAAAAALIGEVGLSQVTLEAVAARANCSVDSLYLAVGNRDTLLAAAFEEYSPILDLEESLADDMARDADMSEIVEHMYRSFAAALLREPRLTRALIAEGLSRPNSPIVGSILELNFPRLFAPLRQWIQTEIRRGRMRDLPPTTVLFQLLAPLLMHTVLQPALAGTAAGGAIADECALFADAFVRAVESPGYGGTGAQSGQIGVRK